MTSAERVRAALEHREPDRIPIDFSGHRSSGISALAYARLRDHLRLPARPLRVYDPVQQLAIVDDDVLALFGVDTIELGRGFALDEASWADWVLSDGTPCQIPVWALPERVGEDWVLRATTGRAIARMPAGALYFEQTYWPFAAGAERLDAIGEALGESMWAACGSPPGPQGSDTAALADGARQLRASTDRAIIGLFGGNFLELGEFLYGLDAFLLLLAAEPRRAHAFLDRVLQMHLTNLERYLGAVGKCLDVIAFGDDLGMQTGPLISPAMYREFLKPREAQLWGRAKELTEAKVMMHCCGGVRELLPDLIEAGLEAINPVQTNCRGMAAADLKRDFGRDLAFWGGGCDTRDVLPNATPQAVREHVRQQVELLAPGGGFVFQQVHNILADVPPENVVAMFEAVRG